MGGDGLGGDGLGDDGLGGGGLGGGGAPRAGGGGRDARQFSTQMVVDPSMGSSSAIVPYVPLQESLLAACALGMPRLMKLLLVRAERKAAAAAVGPPA